MSHKCTYYLYMLTLDTVHQDMKGECPYLHMRTSEDSPGPMDFFSTYCILLRFSIRLASTGYMSIPMREGSLIRGSPSVVFFSTQKVSRV